MKFVIQRVKKAKVDVDGVTVGQIDKGFMVLIGVCQSDTKEIADKMGVMRQQITRFENMSNSPTIFFLVKYANALDTELDVILNGVEIIEVANGRNI